jgi:phosphopantetheinyl transferase
MAWESRHYDPGVRFGGEVLVLWADTRDWPAGAAPALLGAAEPDTRHRVDRLHRADDQVTVLAAHLLARAGAAREIGRPLAEVSLRHQCPGCGGTDHGRPSLVAGDERIPVSVSHTRTLAVVALSPDGEIGVDVETSTEVPLTAEFFTGAEQAAARTDPTGRTGRDTWAAKEALGKLDGRGILAPLAGVEVLDGAVRRLTDSAPSGWLTHLSIPRDASVAIAYGGPVAARVDPIDFDALVELTRR